MSMGKQLRIDLDLRRALLSCARRGRRAGCWPLPAAPACGAWALPSWRPGSPVALALSVLARGVFERPDLLGTDMAGRVIGTHDEVSTDKFHRFVKRAIFRGLSMPVCVSWRRILRPASYCVAGATVAAKRREAVPVWEPLNCGGIVSSGAVLQRTRRRSCV